MRECIWVPKPDKNGVRRYGVWAGNPRGVLEDKSSCAWEVSQSVGWHMVQCSRKRGHGPGGEFCKQHARKFEPADQ